MTLFNGLTLQKSTQLSATQTFHCGDTPISTRLELQLNPCKMLLIISDLVSSVVSADLCDKAFLTHRAFSAGIYSIGNFCSFFFFCISLKSSLLGCACDKNITLGFEIMLNQEGPKNLFRILQCRDVDMNSLKGILVDHACLVDPYILNR